MAEGSQEGENIRVVVLSCRLQFFSRLQASETRLAFILANRAALHNHRLSDQDESSSNLGGRILLVSLPVASSSLECGFKSKL